MPGQVKGDHTETVRHRRICHQMAKLTGIATGGVQANKRDAVTSFLKIDANRPLLPSGSQIAANNRLQRCAHATKSCSVVKLKSRGIAITSLKYLRFDMNG